MTCKGTDVNESSLKPTLEFRRSVKIFPMKKDTRLTFRVRSDMKRELEAIAGRETQSVARICEAFLLAGLDTYKKEGTKLLQRIMGRLSTKSLD